VKSNRQLVVASYMAVTDL